MPTYTCTDFLSNKLHPKVHQDFLTSKLFFFVIFKYIQTYRKVARIAQRNIFLHYPMEVYRNDKHLHQGSSCHGSVVLNLTGIHEDACSILALLSGLKIQRCC